MLRFFVDVEITISASLYSADLVLKFCFGIVIKIQILFCLDAVDLANKNREKN